MRRSACLIIGLLIARYLFARKTFKLDLLERLHQAGF